MNGRVVRAAIAALGVIGFSQSANATDVVGAITGDTNWTLAGSPYVLNDDVYVNSGATLTIEPGVEVHAATSGDVELIVREGGTVIADAEGGDPIVFKPVSGTSSGSWEGLVFESDASATLKNVRIEYADYALELQGPADTQYTIDGVSIFAYRSRGVTVGSGGSSLTLAGLDIDQNGTTSGDGVYVSSGPSLTVSNSRFIGGARAIQAANTSVTVDHTIIAGMHNEGLRATVSTAATFNTTVTYSTFYDNAEALEIQRSSSSSYRHNLSITKSVFGENGYLVRDTSHSSYRVAFNTFRDNVWWGGGFSIGANTPSSNTGNLNYNALLADPDNGDFEPTDRSPARYFAPGTPSAGAGAVPHNGAETGEGVHGFWYVDQTFAVDSETTVLGDVVVTPGVTLTFLPGAQFDVATSDVMEGGLDSARVEIRVEGTLEADGTLSRPVIFRSASGSPSPRDWYGIVIPDDAEAFNVAQVEIGHAYRGVSLYDNDHIVAGATIHHCSDAAVWIDGGTPSVEQVNAHDNNRGVYVSGATGVTLVDVDAYDNTGTGLYITNSVVNYTGGRVYDNGQQGLYITANTAGTFGATLRNLTVAHNGQEGIEVIRSSSSSYRQSLTLRDVSVTHNGAAGVRDSSHSSYRATFSCSGSNSWGNGSTNWYSVTAGSSCFSYNPLYADADARDYEPTAHSPNRGLGTSGGHVGAIAHDGAVGPQLMGYLWEDFTFTAEDSPYTILGDIIVPEGVTVTFDPGAELRIAPNADGMGGGRSQSRTEIDFLDESIADFDGTGEPILITPNTDSPSTSMWEGIYFTDGRMSEVNNAVIEWARYGVHVTGPGAPSLEDTEIRYAGTVGIYAVELPGGTDQTLEVLACSIIGNGSGTGIQLANAEAEISSTYITHTSTGVNATSNSGNYIDVWLTNNTIVHQATGISMTRSSSSSYRLTMHIYNNVIAGSSSYAVRDNSHSSYRPTVTLRNNNFYDRTTLSGSFTSSTANITTNPLVEDDDWDSFPRWWDGKLWAESPAIDQGYASAPRLPARDRLGRDRSIGGGVDIGAFEFDPDANREPRADAVEDAIMVPMGEVFSFDGSAALDPDGFIASAYWTMSDGTVTAGQSVEHTFLSAGESHWGYITVIDDEGAEDHARVDVNVNIRPIADAGPAVFQDEGPDESVFFDGTLSTDPDGSVVAWAWDFGDGSPSSTEASPRHSYESAGTYVVTLTVRDNEGLTHSDTTLATVFGSDDSVGPYVGHSEVPDGQPIGAPVMISAEITDPSDVSSAILFYRAIGDVTASFVLMTNTSGDNYSAVIPGGAVGSAGVEYWIQAADAATPENNSSIWPSGAPTSAVWDFLVSGDEDAPTITHTPIADDQENGEALTVVANVVDATGIDEVHLYFRTSGAASFGAVSMTNTTGSTWSAQIPGFVVAPPGVQYYIEASDTSPIPNTGTAPSDAPTSVYAFSVSTGDTVAPLIAHAPVADGQPEGEAVSIAAGVADTGGEVAAVSVHYRAAGSAGAFTTLPLAAGTGTNWGGSIPADQVNTPGIEYYLSATDDSDNASTDPSDAPGTYHSFTVTELDTAGPTVLHTPVADGQAEAVAVDVSATVSDPSGVARVELRYRPQGFPIYSSLDLTDQGGGVFSGQIPAFSVAAPGIEYYLRAIDEEGNITRHPAAGESDPHAFTVVAEDATAPNISHSPITGPEPEGEDLSVSCTVFDANAVSVTLYYRVVGAGSWTDVAMAAAGDNYSVDIPGAAVTPDGVEYYIHAADAAENEAASPAEAPTTYYTVSVDPADVEGPTIAHAPISAAQDAGVPVTVEAIVYDPSDVASVTLYARTVGAGAFDAIAMTEGAAGSYAADIPGGTVAAPGVEYFIHAVDASTASNERTAPEGGASAPTMFAVVVPDTTGPSISHTPVTTGVAGADIAITASISDPSGVASAVVRWWADGEAAADIPCPVAEACSVAIPASALDGDEETVNYRIVATDGRGNSAADPGVDTAYAVTIVYPDTEGPSVDVSVPSDVEVGTPISVTVTASDSESGVSTVLVEYRLQGAAAWVSVASSGTEPDFAATIPGDAVLEPGVEVRATVTDGVGNGTTSDIETVRVDPIPDTEGPTIEVSEVEDGQLQGAAVTVVAEVSDSSGVGSVYLYYRATGGGGWTIAAASESDGTWSADIPAGAVTLAGVDYYVAAEDSAPAANGSTAPVDAPTSFYSFTVSASDTAGPTLSHVAPSETLYAGETVALSVNATDGSGVSMVSLWYRDATDLFVELPLDNDCDGGGASSTWETCTPVTVPARDSFDYYFTARDTEGNTSSDPASAPATWRSRPVETRDVVGPTITVTPIANGQTVAAAVAIVTDISDDSGVVSAAVWVRTGDSGAFTEIALTPGAGDAWTGIVPGAYVAEPFVEYYVVATDGAEAANSATSPAGAPAALHRFTVGSTPTDTTPPAIAHSGLTATQTAGNAVSVSAVVADASGVAGVSVVHRVRGTDAWTTTPLADTAGSWSGEIPGGAVQAPGVEYYLRAVDSSAAANAATAPADAPATVYGFDVSEGGGDTTPPVITLTDATGPFIAGTPITLGAEVTDASGVAEARLYTRFDDGAWESVVMTNASGDLYSATIAGGDVVAGTLDYYVSATDTESNTATAPANGASAPESIVVDEAGTVDEEPPTLLHAPVTTAAAGEDVDVQAIATDASGIASVVVRYRELGGGAWGEATLSDAGSDTFVGEIPGDDVTSAGLEYYLLATDDSDAANAATSPETAPEALHTVTVIGGPADPGADAGSDAGFDGGSDAGVDGGSDAGSDAGGDAGGSDTGGSDAGTPGGPSGGSGGGCASARTASGPAGGALWLAFLVGLAALVRRRR